MCFFFLSFSYFFFFFFFSSRRRHTRWTGDWSSDVCSSDLSRPSTAQCTNTSPPPRSRKASTSAARCGIQSPRSEERRVGKSVDLGGRRIIKKKKKKRRVKKRDSEEEEGYRE